MKKIAQLKRIDIKIKNYNDQEEIKQKYQNRAEVKQSYFFRFSSVVFSAFYTFVHAVLFKSWYNLFYEEKTTLFGKMCKIKIPVLFVHSEHDMDAPIEQVQKLMEEVKQNMKETYFVKYAKHACVQMRYFDDYKKKLLAFIENCLERNRNEQQ